MKFKPGYYIIKEGPFPSSYHYMRVFVKNGKRYMEIDLREPFEAEIIERSYLNIYEIDIKLSKDRPIQVEDPEIKITWRDGPRHFTWKVSNIPSLLEMFRKYPRIAKALGVNGKITIEPKL